MKSSFKIGPLYFFVEKFNGEYLLKAMDDTGFRETKKIEEGTGSAIDKAVSQIQKYHADYKTQQNMGMY